MPFYHAFKLIGKVFRSTTKRPLQRFNIYNRSKKFIGEESKHFFPAPRAIGPVSKIGPSQYPHLEGSDGFKSVTQRRLEAIASRNQKLLESGEQNSRADGSDKRSYSETIQDDNLVIKVSQKLPVIKTISRLVKQSKPEKVNLLDQAVEKQQQSAKIARPLPKLVNLNMQDPRAIWAVEKLPTGRLDLNKLQELMVNKLADDKYWTSKQISETYNIKEEYAENIVSNLKQIRIVISPRMAKILDYINRTDESYQATKNVIYIVDKSLRTELDKSCDGTFLPEDELDDNIRSLLDSGQVQRITNPKELYNLKRPEPLMIRPVNAPKPFTKDELKSLPPPKRPDTKSRADEQINEKSSAKQIPNKP